MSVAAVVVAAGRGSRFGGRKQFTVVGGESVTARSVRQARSVADVVILVTPADYDGTGEGADILATGGETRAASVRAGLAACDGAEIVVVHDAARPLASGALFRAVVDEIRGGADAAVPGLVVSDTIKRVAHVGGDVVVEATLDREGLVAVQTPQAFRYEVLVRAHESGAEASDDAGLVEALGVRVHVVPGETANVKITHASDLWLLDVLARSEA